MIFTSFSRKYHCKYLNPLFLITSDDIYIYARIRNRGDTGDAFLTSQNKTRSNLRSSCQGYMNGAFHAISLIILYFAPPLTRRQSVFNIRFSFFFFFLFSLFLFQISIDTDPDATQTGTANLKRLTPLRAAYEAEGYLRAGRKHVALAFLGEAQRAPAAQYIKSMKI